MSQSFADIYSKWEQSHNEQDKISKRIVENEKELEVKNTITKTQLNQMPVQDELDLHNEFVESAVLKTRAFIESSWHKNYKKVRIITGKGIHSPGGKAVVRPAVIDELRKCKHISSIDVNPKAKDGGCGAVVVLLKS